MDRHVTQEQHAGTMRSSIAWALLGLVIERPSYGYELLQRFRRVYGETLVITSPARIYTGLESLKARELIEEVDGSAAETTHLRQPRPRYRATTRGIAAYQDWLFTQIEAERQRHRLFARQLAMLEPQAALDVIDEYERECLTGADDTPPAESEREGVAERLAEGEEQLNLTVRLRWIEYARNELKAVMGHHASEEKQGTQRSTQQPQRADDGARG